MSFVLSNLHMNNLSNDIVSTIKQLVDDLLLPFILNAKTWAYELDSNLKNKSEWALCYLLIQIWTNRLRLYNLKFQGQQNHILGSTNCKHGDERACNVHTNRFLCAQNYVHVNQSKSPLCLKANNAWHKKIWHS